MAQVIIYQNPDGLNVCVCTPAIDLDIEWVQQKDTPEGSVIVDSSELPEADYDFFDAWRLVGGVVSVNLAAAKELTKARLRVEREPLLAAQDVLFQRALEASADTTAIVAEKNRLRNLPEAVDNCTTLDQLRNIHP